MSGGYFDYNQYKIGQIADDIEQLVLTNKSEELNSFGERKGRFYSQDTINKFVVAHMLLKQAEVYAQRIDYLLSGDDDETTFHKRVTDDLLKIDFLES
jgi:hypothetical protein